MKLLLVVCLALAVQAVTVPPTQRVCCYAPGATTCTANIPAGLCTAAGGRYDQVDTSGTCCCFGANAGSGDRCLPDVPRVVCLGASVQGRCQAADVERCCCRPAGVVSDLDCIPRVPKALCDKTTGAACVVAPTPVPTCTCTIPGNPARVLPESVCTKFGGTCATSAPATCCCIYDGQVDLFGNPITPDPTDPGVPARGECLQNTRVSVCHESTTTRTGVCWTGPVTGGAAAPRCECQDPTITDRVQAIIDSTTNQPALLLRHVCEEKLGSHCLVPTCCCKYPSAPNEPCLPDTQIPTCTAVGGALCVNVLARASLQANQLEEFGTAACGSFTTASTGAADPRELVRVSGTGGVAAPGVPTNVFQAGLTLQNLGTNVPLYNLKIFGQQPNGDERVYTRFLGGSLTFELVPASANFVLGGVNLKGSVSQLPAQAEYVLDIVPSTVTPAILSGFIDGNNLRATVTNIGVGKWRISFSNTPTTVTGLIGFDNAVNSVKVTFPSPVAGAPADFGTTSGFFASFKTPWTLPTARDINPNGNFQANVVEGPAAPGGAATTPQGTAGASPSDVFAALPQRETTACYAQFNSLSLFPTLPAPRVLPLGGLIGDVRLSFPTPPANSLLLHFANIAANNGAVICIYQNGVPTTGVALPVKRPSAVDTIGTDRCFTVTTETNFVVQVYGTPSEVIVNFNGLQSVTTTAPALGTAPTVTASGPVLGLSYLGTGAAPTAVSTTTDAQNTAYNGGFVLANSAFTTL